MCFGDAASWDSPAVLLLFHKLVDRLTQRVEGLLVVVLDSVDDAVLDVVLQDHLADVRDRCAHGGDLDEALAAVPAVGDQLPHGLQMAEGAEYPVQDGLRVFVHMAVAVRGVVAVGMIVRLVVGIRFVVQVGNVVLMQVRMVVRMLVFHGGNAPYIINYL